VRLDAMASHPIPEAALDADIAVLGRKGGGKTYTAKGIVERLLDMGRRVLVLDPLGVWAGLRTSVDGEGPGYPVAIFGGPHADMPLDTAAAVAMADVLALENVPAVIDLSELTKGAQQAFLLAFLHELRRVNVEALTIVLEEADVFAPQNPQGDDSKQLHHEIDWIARRGRFKGFRLLTICQRPARLSKDVLTQAATLVAHRLPAPQDRDAVKAWVEGNGDRDQAKSVFDTLARLEVGEAWVWASEQGTLERRRFPPISTLDTSATPKAGEKRIEPKTLAEVDVSSIRVALAAAKPTTTKLTKNTPENIPAEIEAAEQRGYRRGLEEGSARGRLAGIAIGLARARLAIEALRVDDEEIGISATIEAASGGPVDVRVRPADTAIVQKSRAAGLTTEIAANHLKQTIESGRGVRASPATKPEKPADLSTEGLTGPQQTVLNGLAWWSAAGNETPTRAMLAAVCGWSVSSGHLKNVLGSLRTKELVVYPTDGVVAATAGGVLLAQLPSGTLRDRLLKLFSGPQRSVYEALIGHREVTRADLAGALGWEPTSGHLKNVLGSLRTLDIVTYPAAGTVALTAWVANVH
jgi:Helicase HerA, central domain/Bacterial protein of unknown function (DUF853)